MEGATDSYGFMHAKLIFDGGDGEEATSTNVPNNKRVFAHSGFKQHIDSKFSENEFFELECSEVEDFRPNVTDACMYGAFASSAQGVNGQITSILITSSIFDPNTEIVATSSFKPTKPSALIFNLEALEPPFIAGPFEPFNTAWDEKSKSWSSSFRAYTSTKSFRSLRPAHLYKLALDNLPSEQLLCPEVSSQSYSNCVSVSLFNYMETIQTESVDFIDDGALLRMLDASLDKDYALGRKKRRELLSQAENAKGFSSVHVNRIEVMLRQIDNTNDSLEQFRLKFMDAAPQLNLEGQQESNIKLKSENESLKNQLTELKSNLTQVQMGIGSSNQNVSDENNQKIKEMEDELNHLREIVTEEANIDQMRGRLQELTEQTDSKQEEKVALDSAVLDLKNKYNESTADFRKKAHEVLPFIEMLNASANISSINPTFFEDPERAETDFNDITEIVNLIKDRVAEQNYEVDDISLAQAVFFQCESRFLCFFGAPGTGKTSFARALSNAVTGGKGNTLFQGIEKGWSTSEDLIGHKNPFVNQFIYNDDFFKKLHFHSTHKNAPKDWLSIICDEGNLSPVEQYLAFLIGRDEEFNSRKDFTIQIDQHPFLIPKSLRLFFTMNFDFTTESVSPRFIDRTPVITCDEIEGLETNFKSISFEAPIEFNKMMMVYDSAVNNVDTTKVEFLEDMYEKFQPDPDTNILPKSRRRSALQQKYLKFMSHFEFEAELVMDELILSTRLPQINGQSERYRDALSAYETKINLLQKSSRHLNRIINTGDDFEMYSFFS